MPNNDNQVAGYQSAKGISLIELIMFIVIVSAALSGILLVMNTVTRNSADPLIHKQALSIAESLLEEIELMPFTYCDPDDANAAVAGSAVVGAGACATTVEAMGPETAQGEARGSATFPFDNVNDYDGYTMAGANIKDIAGNPIGNLGGYSASVAMTRPNLGTIAGTDANGAPQVLLINVTVTGPDNMPITLESYRTRYASRAVP